MEKKSLGRGREKASPDGFGRSGLVARVVGGYTGRGCASCGRGRCSPISCSARLNARLDRFYAEIDRRLARLDVPAHISGREVRA